MDFKKNTKLSRPNSSSAKSHFNESNAGHLFVQATSPFKIKNSELTTADASICKRNIQSTSVLSKKLPKDACSSATSKLLINQIIKDNSLDANRLNLNIEAKSNYCQHFNIKHIEFQSSTPTINSKSSSMQHGLCSRAGSVAAANMPSTVNGYNTRNRRPTQITVEEKQFAEKTTYCRPIFNYQNQEYLQKTLERNNRLQRLVKKLIIARKREKESEAWNNYINELKSKHGKCDKESLRVSDYHIIQECRQKEFVHDNCSSITPSSCCKDLLSDFYGAHCVLLNESRPTSPYCSDSYTNCFPISSQGRLMMLNRERQGKGFAYDWKNVPSYRRSFRDTIFVEKKPASRKGSTKSNDKNVSNNHHENIKIDNKPTKTLLYPDQPTVKSEATQTMPITEDTASLIKEEVCEIKPESKFETTPEDINRKGSLRSQYNIVSENVERLKRQIQETLDVENSSLLANIEEKLDSLINSLNLFMQDVQSQSQSNSNKCEDCDSVCFQHNKGFHDDDDEFRSDKRGLIKSEKFICGMTSNSLRKSKLNKSYNKDVNNIIIEEISNSIRANKEFESILNKKVVHPCSVQISFDILKQERSTEVTDSLSKAVLRLHDKSVSMVDIRKDDLETNQERRITMAVNTDPLGLFGLLKVSTEAAKQLISYMPNIPYQSLLLSMMTYPQPKRQSQFVCNICGAAFQKPSQLSDHIQGHSLGKARDCCVCRHILDLQHKKYSGLFRCQYCGQRFTRAYCCELHQESCARRLGKSHDVTQSLLILR